MRDLPVEYEHEPRVALEAEAEGTALALRVLRTAARLLTSEGLLVLEVGETAETLECSLPRVPLPGLTSLREVRGSPSSVRRNYGTGVPLAFYNACRRESCLEIRLASFSQ